MTAAEIVQHSDIVAVARDLGFDVGRGNRAPCLICGARNPTTFSLRADTKSWRCFRCDRSGGVLKLITEISGGAPADALRWLANNLGLPLTNERMTPAERRSYAKRRREAERRTALLPQVRQQRIDELRNRRNALWDAERAACRLALRLLREGDDESPHWDPICRHVRDDKRGDLLNAELERIERMTPVELWAELHSEEGEA